jgi:hypothetical protein
VFIHVAADNYFMPVLMGTAAPADTGINIEGRGVTVAAFEKRSLTRDEILTQLERSFAFLKKSMEATTRAELDAQAKFERRKMTTRVFWIRTTTHLHEHLGQLIAYARSNEVTPPWSK